MSPLGVSRAAVMPEVPGHRAAGGWRIRYRPASGPGRLPVFIAIPDTVRPGVPPLIAVHGIGRGAPQTAKMLAPRAAATGAPVIAPVFDAERWPRYQQVVVRGRADLALIALLKDLSLEGIDTDEGFDLFGFSGGAQFAHRFAMLYPDLVRRLTVASAGWWTFPDRAPFPYGLGPPKGQVGDWGSEIARNLDGFLRLSIKVCIGELDQVSDANTRRGPVIDEQQGTDRLTRARRWVEALGSMARERGLAPPATFHVLAGCGHDFGDCVRIGGLDRIIVDDSGTHCEAGRSPGSARPDAAG